MLTALALGVSGAALGFYSDVARRRVQRTLSCVLASIVLAALFLRVSEGQLAISRILKLSLLHSTANEIKTPL